MSKDLVSKVWKLSGLFGSVLPGVLVWKKGRVLFITEEGVQFDVPLTSIKDLKWPFLRMRMGFDATINEKKYKFSFSKPNPSAPEITIKTGSGLPDVLYSGHYMDDISSLRDIKKDKATTKMWKEILCSAS